MYWIPGKLRTPLHRRSGREVSRASRGGPGRGTFRKSIGMAVYSGFLCVAPPWPSSRSWFCFEGPDPFPCPGQFVGSFSRQSRCSAPPFPSSMSVSLCRVRPFSNVGLTEELDLHTCSHFCYAGAPVSQCPGVPMPAHRKWLLPATVVWLFDTGGRLIVGGWEHAASRIPELEPCARPTPPGGLESNPSCLGAYFRTTCHAKMCAAQPSRPGGAISRPPWDVRQCTARYLQGWTALLTKLSTAHMKTGRGRTTPRGAGCTSGSVAPSRPLTVRRLAGRDA